MRSATIHFAPITAFQTHTSPQAFPPENLTFWMFEEDGFVRQAKKEKSSNPDGLRTSLSQPSQRRAAKT